MQYKARSLSSFCERTGLWVRCPTSLPSRKVSDESLGRNETSCVRLGTNNELNISRFKFLITNRFHVVVRLLQEIDQRLRQNVVRTKKVAHKAIAECVTDVLTTF